MFYARCSIIHLLIALLSVFRLAHGASTVSGEEHTEGKQTPTIDQALKAVIDFMMKDGFIFTLATPGCFKIKLKPEDCKTDIEHDNNLAVGFYGYSVWLSETNKRESGKPENEKSDHEGCTCTQLIALYKKAQTLQLDSGWLCVINAFCNRPHTQQKADSFFEMIGKMVAENEITIQDAQSVFAFGSDMIGMLLVDDPALAEKGWNFRYILTETRKRQDQILIVNAMACCVAKGWKPEVYQKIIGDTTHSNVQAGLKVAVIEHFFEKKSTNGFIDESTFPKIANNFMQILILATDINMDHENNKQFVRFFFERIIEAMTWDLKTASDVLKYYCINKSKPIDIVGEMEQMDKTPEKEETVRTFLSTVSSFLADTSNTANTLCQ